MELLRRSAIFGDNIHHIHHSYPALQPSRHSHILWYKEIASRAARQSVACSDDINEAGFYGPIDCWLTVPRIPSEAYSKTQYKRDTVFILYVASLRLL